MSFISSSLIDLQLPFHRRKALPVWTKWLGLAIVFSLTALPVFAQSARVKGVVTDPSGAVVANATVTLTNQRTRRSLTSTTDGQGVYRFDSLTPGSYSIEVHANGFEAGAAGPLNVAAGQSVDTRIALTVAGRTQSVTVTAGSFENAYRVDTLSPATPFGATPIVNLPYTINVISRQLIADTMSRNFKEVAKYLPLVSFQEMQGPEILRPETRGMQGTNMQGDRMDGMGFAVTVPFALEEYKQIEVLSGVGGSMYGPSNPSGTFNFVSKTPTEEPLREAEVEYEGRSVVTGHADLGGRLGPNKIFGYRINLLLGDGTGYVTNSQLRRQLAAGNFDLRPFAHTTVGGSYNYYNLYQHGYPGWFSYNPTLNPTAVCTTTYKSKCFSELPVNAPDPARQGYGQRFLGSSTNNQIGEVRASHEFGPNWRLMLGVLQQIGVRNLTTAVNALFDSTGDYQTEAENIFQGTISGRFQVKSDLGYVTGNFRTGRLAHQVVIGSTGYKFSSWNPKTAVPGSFLCALDDPTLCHANIAGPLLDANPGYTPYTGKYSLYVTSSIHQQGFNFGDTIALTPRWLIRAAASQDWTWTTSYKSPGGPAYETPGYMSQAASPTGSVMYKPARNQTAYVTYADSVQAPDTAPANSTGVIVANANQALPPYRSTEVEMGYKVESRRMNFTTDVFRIRRPFADVEETSTTAGYNCGGTPLPAGDICENDQIIGQQVNFGAEAMLSGNVTRSLRVIGGITALNPKLTHTFVLLPAGNPYVSAACKDPAGVAASALICPSSVTNNRNLVGIPDYKSNILAEYQLPALSTAFFTFDWQHVSRRPADDMNSYYVPQYNTFDLGGRYSALVFGKLATWLLTVNNITDVHYWSTLGPGSITGQSSADLAHLGEPRLITASVRYDF
ncbi:MAG TPA: TonB-dependent receptor [Acidobacteriaceae bacterium]|nr:TonB-dependent receptor [Acidobacteriaceae bacterium]